MQVISHRGQWIDAAEKNLPVAFSRSFDNGFGTETDVRDCRGELLVSHDMPTGSEPTLEALIAMLAGRDLPLAINVKADGMAKRICQVMDRCGVRDWFVFDMSIPDTRGYFDAGAPVFVRMSEVERAPPWLDRAAGVWLDAFDGLWYDVTLISGFLDRGLRVCVVSPELHRRDPQPGWELIKPLAKHPRLMLCTDLPLQAKLFLGAST